MSFGGSQPKDNSVALARIEAATQRAEREEQRRKEEQQRQRFETSLNSSYSAAVDEARNYFIQRGLNPDDYIGAIQRGATSARSRVPDLASAPGTFFENLGATVYDTERGAKRGTLMRDINTFAPEGFSTRRIADTSDDAILESIFQEQRANADSYLRNLLDRGVITNTGYNAGLADLDRQGYGAKSRLTEIGNVNLERGRGQANQLAAEARQRASNFELGDSFNPYDYSGQLDSVFSNFFQGLGGDIRAALPSNLFQTSGLANIAGAAQGPQNTKFNPQAIAGMGEEDEDEEERSFLSAF